MTLLSFCQGFAFRIHLIRTFLFDKFKKVSKFEFLIIYLTETSSPVQLVERSISAFPSAGANPRTLARPDGMAFLPATSRFLEKAMVKIFLGKVAQSEISLGTTATTRDNIMHDNSGGRKHH